MKHLLATTARTLFEFQTYRVEVGARGMGPLVRILDQDRSDVEIINLALETLAEIIHEQDQLGEQFTEIFIKDSNNVGLLLELIEVRKCQTHEQWLRTLDHRKLNDERNLSNS